MAVSGRLTNYAAHSLLNHIHAVAEWEAPTLWAAALTGAPTDDGLTTNEVEVDGYARVETEWSVASSRTISNAADIEFEAAEESWGTISHIGLFDSEVRGNLIGYFPALDAKAIGATSILKIEKNTGLIRVATPLVGFGGLTDYLANAVCEHLTGKRTFPFPTSLYLMAMLSAPGNDGTYEEVTGTDYARVLANGAWSPALNRLVDNRSDLTFPVAGGDWGTISHIGVIQTATPNNGILYWWAPVTNPDTIVSGDTLSFPAGDIRATL